MDAFCRPESDLRVWTLAEDGTVAVHRSNIGAVRTQSILGWTITDLTDEQRG